MSTLRRTLVGTTLAAVLFGPTVARAQSSDRRGEPTATARSLVAEALYAARAENTARDEAQAWVLLGWGGFNVLAGTTFAIAPPGGDLGRSIAVNSLIWGAVNTAIAIPWVLGARRERRRAEEDRALRGPALLERRERALRERDGQALVFAVNTGLDVAYVSVGALLCVLASQPSPRNELLLGAGAAAVAQGTFLLAFDLAGWIAVAARAQRVASVPREEPREMPVDQPASGARPQADIQGFER